MSNHTVEWGGAVQRERGLAIWVGAGKVEVPTLSQRTRQGWGNRRRIKIPTQRKSPFDFAQGRLRVGHPQKTAHSMGMDISWLNDRIAIGGGIWNAENMAKVAAEGITHIIDMQIEFDDTPLAAPYGIEVLWNPTDDDFSPKPAELFQRGVDFAWSALARDDAKLFIHCAAGVHRGPMMALALLGSLGWDLRDAMKLIRSRRAAADLTDVYVQSVEKFLGSQTPRPSRKERS
jgi:protein-tyrosine phosphatase